MNLLPGDWHAVLAPDFPLLELVGRGTALYFGLLILMRMGPRRLGGEIATMDLIFILLIAEAAAHALGDYTSIADGFVVIAVLIGWDWLLNSLSYHVPLIEKLVSAPPVLVIRNGKFLHRNMRKEYLTKEELLGHLREQGLDSADGIKRAYIESDGQLSVVQNK